MKKRVITLVLFMGTFSYSYAGQPLKEPNVSGQFYSDDPAQLTKDIDNFFVLSGQKSFTQKVDMILAPHAGYVFSGPVAAYSFKAVSDKKYSTIVVIAPSHFFSFEGISVWNKGGFKTPLGVVSVDEDFTAKLLKKGENFNYEPSVFEREHAVEVELPFLQKTFKDFQIVPILMGRPQHKVCENLASALNDIIGNREDVLIVVSSDMSHYHDDAFARTMDQGTLAAIENLKAEEFWQKNLSGEMEMCGFTGMMTALLYAKHKGLKAAILKYANSGDATGDTARVVGYGSAVFYEQPNGALTQEQKKKLIQIAKDTMATYLKTGQMPDIKEDDPRLLKVEGAFVTIHKNGQLRGCIGSIIGRQPLVLTIRDMAMAAATQDPRFPPVKADELGDIDIEISVLSVPKMITSVEEIELGVHGVIITRGSSNQGVFLPQVAAETKWSKEQFLSELCSQKAGLPKDCWKDPLTKMDVFTADVFSQKDVN